MTKSLEWIFLDEDEKSDTYCTFYVKLEEGKDNIALVFQQFGLMQSKCRNELKSIREPDPVVLCSQTVRSI